MSKQFIPYPWGKRSIINPNHRLVCSAYQMDRLVFVLCANGIESVCSHCSYCILSMRVLAIIMNYLIKLIDSKLIYHVDNCQWEVKISGLCSFMSVALPFESFVVKPLEVTLRIHIQPQHHRTCVHLLQSTRHPQLHLFNQPVIKLNNFLTFSL